MNRHHVSLSKSDLRIKGSICRFLHAILVLSFGRTKIACRNRPRHKEPFYSKVAKSEDVIEDSNLYLISYWHAFADANFFSVNRLGPVLGFSDPFLGVSDSL